MQVSRSKGRDGHSATFPAAVIKPRIESSCPPGGLVVDPFCGTGRTLEVAVESGRRAYGMELSTSSRAIGTRQRTSSEGATDFPAHSGRYWKAGPEAMTGRDNERPLPARRDPGSLAALHELGYDLIRVDVAGVNEYDVWPSWCRVPS